MALRTCTRVHTHTFYGHSAGKLVLDGTSS